MARYLIVNADDLGLSKGVNQGIFETAEHGILNRPQAGTIRNLRAPMENSNVEDDQKSTNPRCLPDDKAVPPEHDEELEPACALR
jgi:hypothetical protein